MEKLEYVIAFDIEAPYFLDDGKIITFGDTFLDDYITDLDIKDDNITGGLYDATAFSICSKATSQFIMLCNTQALNDKIHYSIINKMIGPMDSQCKTESIKVATISRSNISDSKIIATKLNSLGFDLGSILDLKILPIYDGYKYRHSNMRELILSLQDPNRQIEDTDLTNYVWLIKANFDNIDQYETLNDLCIDKGITPSNGTYTLGETIPILLNLNGIFIDKGRDHLVDLLLTKFVLYDETVHQNKIPECFAKCVSGITYDPTEVDKYADKIQIINQSSIIAGISLTRELECYLIMLKLLGKDSIKTKMLEFIDKALDFQIWFNIKHDSPSRDLVKELLVRFNLETIIQHNPKEMQAYYQFYRGVVYGTYEGNYLLYFILHVFDNPVEYEASGMHFGKLESQMVYAVCSLLTKIGFDISRYCGYINDSRNHQVFHTDNNQIVFGTYIRTLQMDFYQNLYSALSAQKNIQHILKSNPIYETPLDVSSELLEQQIDYIKLVPAKKLSASAKPFSSKF